MADNNPFGEWLNKTLDLDREEIAPVRVSMANAIRFLSADAVEQAQSGHPGMPMGMADVATILFSEFLKFDAENPLWPDRDRFVLSAGHGSMLLYSLLYLSGYRDMTIDEIKNFRQLGSKTAGHPEFGHASGIETTTGPLGQGLAMAIGMALAERINCAKFGKDLVDHFTYVIVGDGCLMEGVSHESISFAGHLKLSKLIVLFDDNSISIDGDTNLAVSDNQLERFGASGWDVKSIDGHDYDQIITALQDAQLSDRPSLIACKTIIGFGAPNKAGTAASHGSPLGKEELAEARNKLGWESQAFEVPEEIINIWRSVGRRSQKQFTSWSDRLTRSDPNTKEAFDLAITGHLSEELAETVNVFKEGVSKEKPKWATRKASGEFLESLVNILPTLTGGSADLTGSNNTKTSKSKSIEFNDFSGSYIYYGVREFGMAAIMNGMALHGGVIPYGGTFLVFADYMRPAIRLSALMKQRVIYILTHDSIGLGEDGPTHQPVETLASLRAIPNLNVFRPADPVEVAECWALALASQFTPSVIALTRQGVPTLRKKYMESNLCESGGYIISKSDLKPAVTIISSGSEVAIAVEVQEELALDNIGVNVVSMPSWEMFDNQSVDYQRSILGSGLRVGLEAAVEQGWHKYLGDSGIFVGMKGFGSSAPAEQLYDHFKINVQSVVEAIKSKL